MQNVHITVLKLQKSSNTKQPFSFTDKLMVRQSSTPLSTKPRPNELPELSSNCFCNKVRTIRDQLNQHLPVTINKDSPYTQDDQFSRCSSNSSTSISQNSLRKTILHCARKTCELDAISTSLLLECFDEILPILTDVVNHDVNFHQPSEQLS